MKPIITTIATQPIFQRIVNLQRHLCIVSFCRQNEKTTFNNNKNVFINKNNNNKVVTWIPIINYNSIRELSTASTTLISDSETTSKNSNNSTDDSSNSTTTTTNKAIKKKRSLALTVSFHHPDLNMKGYEILIRGSAFLLSVDAKDPTLDEKPGPYGHLQAAQRRREESMATSDTPGQNKYHPGTKYSTASGPEGRRMMDMSWLEFVPKEVRPQVHIVTSSHVASPFLWREYYPQDWLGKVKQEHVTYDIEIIEDDDDDKIDMENNSEVATTTTTKTKTIAKVPINSLPYHHPEGRDIALLHFREERTALRLLKKYGVEILYLRDMDKMYEKGEELYFDGYVLKEPDTIDSSEYLGSTNTTSDDNSTNGTTTVTTEEQIAKKEVDTRVYYPHIEKGTLSFHHKDRFFATTPTPLSMGFCGAPVLDRDGDCCGTVEGIIPLTHKNPKLAGNAGFVPSYVMKVFIDYVERGLLEKMMPKDLFQLVVTAKKTNSIGGGIFRLDKQGQYTEDQTVDEAYDLILNNLKKKYKPHEVDAILAAVARERDEVMEVLSKENDVNLDEVMGRARMKTIQIHEMVKDQDMKQQLEEHVPNEEEEK